MRRRQPRPEVRSVSQAIAEPQRVQKRVPAVLRTPQLRHVLPATPCSMLKPQRVQKRFNGWLVI